MSLEIPALPKGTLAEGGDRGEPTAIVKERVNHARTNMLNRSGKVNALLGSPKLALRSAMALRIASESRT